MTINRIVELLARARGALVIAAAIGLLVGRNARAAEGDFNACGCRPTGQGICVCEKKSKCGCPGECEPKGCEERRAKQIEKEIQAETKKAEEASRRQNRTPAAQKNPSGEDESAPAKSGGTSGAAPKGPKMTAAQKHDLARLLGSYLAEHPDEGNKTIEQVRDGLRSEAAAHPK